MPRRIGGAELELDEPPLAVLVPIPVGVAAVALPAVVALVPAAPPAAVGALPARRLADDRAKGTRRDQWGHALCEHNTREDRCRRCSGSSIWRVWRRSKNRRFVAVFSRVEKNRVSESIIF